jgi:hypothetical protein
LPTFQIATGAIIALVMDSASIPETSVNFHHNTQRSIPKDSHLQLFLCFSWQMLVWRYSSSYTSVLPELQNLHEKCIGTALEEVSVNTRKAKS